MYPVKFTWCPEFIENTPSSCVVTPPLGKPDPYSFRIEKQVRLRIFQKAQEGPTCMFYAAKRISPRFGKFNITHPMRYHEKAVSIFRKEISSTMPVLTSRLEEDQKAYIITRHLSSAGFKAHFPWQASILASMAQLVVRSQINLPSMFPDPKFDLGFFVQKIITNISLRAMLHRMCLMPLPWVPLMGPGPLVQALRAHLYLMCMGQFGKCFFTSLAPCEYHPKLGPIMSGPLKPIEVMPRSYFAMHAVLVVGIRLRTQCEGDVYFIDPVDPSGPGMMQTVYKMHVADFFMRLRDSCGTGPFFSATCEFIWVGIPGLFLA